MSRATVHPEVLFVCTGNYYRSRFAEAVFNHHAERRGLPLRAFSRGLETFRVDPDTHGPLSLLALEGLARRAIDRRHTGPSPRQLCREDLAAARVVVALDELEHRPMFEASFPEVLARVVFWRIPDVPLCAPDDALTRIEAQVLALLEAVKTRAEP